LTLAGNASDGNAEAFCVDGLKITAKLLAEALHTLPDDKRQAVLLYYFFNMTDVEIAEAMKIPRSTVQYRRTSSFEKIVNFYIEVYIKYKNLQILYQYDILIKSNIFLGNSGIHIMYQFIEHSLTFPTTLE